MVVLVRWSGLHVLDTWSVVVLGLVVVVVSGGGIRWWEFIGWGGCVVLAMSKYRRAWCWVGLCWVVTIGQVTRIKGVVILVRMLMPWHVTVVIIRSLVFKLRLQALECRSHATAAKLYLYKRRYCKQLQSKWTKQKHGEYTNSQWNDTMAKD